MKRREYFDEVNFVEENFPAEKFDKSCLIYTKNNYGIFLVTGKDGENYTMKVNSYMNQIPEETITALYIKKKNINMPNLLLPEAIYTGRNPSNYPLFNEEKNRLKLKECKNPDLRSIFNESFTYIYYVTKACSYNLGYYLGTHKGTLTYKAFVAFSFQILAALQSLHNLGVWHRDIKPQNILVCNSDLSQYDGITFIGKDKKSWTIQYSDTGNRDLKIIDYGESFIIRDVKNPCIEFEYEVTVATISVFNLMWSKVVDKEGKSEIFNNLISLLKNCKTSIYDVLQDAEIYDELQYTDDKSYKVYI